MLGEETEIRNIFNFLLQRPGSEADGVGMAGRLPDVESDHLGRRPLS
jgi:hypothetical protein